MLSRILATVREHGLFRAGDAVLVAVSGGPDSMSLLHALHLLAPRLGLTLRAACIDHGLRPAAADEARWVGEQAAALGVPCETVRVDVVAERRRHPGSWQAAARQVRLDALSALASRHGCVRVALGHQADDQAETVLFRVLRGTGLDGLSGIPYVRPPFVRPLLDVTRAEVLRFLQRREIPFREDPSNRDLRYTRSRLRHEVLPLLRRLNPRVDDALRGLAQEASGGRTAALRREAAGRGLTLGARAASTIERLAAAGQGSSTIDIEGGWAEIAYGRVAFHAGPRARIQPGTGDLTVPGPGELRVAGLLPLRVGEGAAPAGAAAFDGDALAWPLHVRGVRPGDRMRPRGGRGSRKLSDLMVDAHIPRLQRPSLPVLVCADGEIIYVPGLRPAERGRPGSSPVRPLWVVPAA